MNYSVLLDEIALLAEKAGRSPKEVKLIAVSKEIPLMELKSAYAQGCRDFAENRLPEALQKQSEMPSDITWHWIGRLQRKKVKRVVPRFAWIHSVDSLDLAKEISATALTCILLQVNTSTEGSKQGFKPQELLSLYDQLQALPNLKIEGLMTMAPLKGDIRGCFAALRHLRDELKKQTKPPHTMHHLSMGMSNDYPIAIEEGATLLRIGTRLFS